MKKRSFFSFLILSAWIFSAEAQEVSLIKFENLQKRFEAGKDTTYVINFWATWCAPCIKEMPHFETLQKQYNSKPLKVIFLSLDFKSKLEGSVKPLVKRLKLQNEVYLVDKKSDQELIDKVSKEWEGAIPGTLFVNKNKNVWQFYQKEYTYQELEKAYQSLN